MNVLQEASTLVDNDRNEFYGHPSIKYEMIAKVWSALFSINITPREVVLAMMAVKLCRESIKHKRDNITDIAGYARILEMVVETTDTQNKNGEPKIDRRTEDTNP